MAVFDTDDAEEILRVLGYQVPYDRLVGNSFKLTQYPETYIDRALAILPLLNSIDKQLIEMLPDSMAVEVGELKLSYPQHQRILKNQAKELLNELANLTGLQIAFNKYRSGNPAVSYW